MHKRTSSLAALTLAAVAAASCGSSTNSTTASQTAPTTVESFCTSLLDELAARAAACNGGPAQAWRPLLEAQLRCEQWTAGVAAGRIAFNGAQTQGCLDAVKTQDCGALAAGDEPTACFPALAGQIAPGGDCFSNAECTGNGSCDTSQSCPGKCLAPLAENASCANTNAPCATGTSCVAGTCKRDSDVNQPCGQDQPACRFGLVCLGPASATTGTCQQRAQSGACSATEACAPSFACAGPSDPGQCIPAKDLGAACTVGNDECTILTSCVSGSCALFPKLGEPCDPTGAGGEATLCLQGFCDTTTKQCTALKAADAACAEGGECESGTCTSGKCTAPCKAP